MTDLRDFVNRVVGRTGFNREKFQDNKLPHDASRIRILPIFGDIRSEFVLSTILLNSLYKDDYLIVCSWPNRSSLYHNAAEYWSLKNEDALSDLVRHCGGMINGRSDVYERLFLRYFDNVVDIKSEIRPYYENGFTKAFWDKFGAVEYTIPTLPSVNLTLGDHWPQSAYKVYLKPSRYATRWSRGAEVTLPIDVDFWIELTQRLLDHGIKPVISQDYGTHDLSTEFGSECIYLSSQDILSLMGVMRACDCVLDVFNGLSRYALIARCPYMICDERQRYFVTKDYELDDLCGRQLPHCVMFSFLPMANNRLSDHLSVAIVNKLTSFLPSIRKAPLPSTLEVTASLPPDNIRQRIAFNIGNRFVSVPKAIEY